ncbi:hypothetical protein AWT69_003869 [Pseudomonas putida]|nr:hypothetical protein AWT69_003869 [Pseudomonas putida]
MLSLRPSTRRGALPAHSMADDSSVTATSDTRHSASARCSMPRRNICGVYACQTVLRSTVAATLPSPSARLSVSRAGTASNPPTGSSARADSNLSRSLRARFGRAASCTSTQSSSDAPWACSSNSALSTESARSRPPGARWIRGSLAQRRPGQ